jgi:Family of unknown function (DUF5317)
VLLFVAAAIGALTVPLAGGRLSTLARVRLRLVPAIFAALAIQAFIVAVVPNGNPVLLRSLHVASYLLAAVFLVANRRIAGMAVIALGAACNLLAILANNGVMPASRHAWRLAGLPTDTPAFTNSAAVAHPRLLVLGDIFAVPKSWPFSNVYSIGDVCIAVGVIVVIHALSESRLIPTRRRAVQEPVSVSDAA